MNDAVIKILSQKEEPKELTEFRTRLQDLVKMSRNTMSEYYPIWDRNDRVYRGERTPDEQDKKAQKRNEPAKVFVPLTHTQVQTFVSFATTLLTQREYFFEMNGSGVEDVKPAKLAQATIQRDLEYNKFEGVLLPHQDQGGAAHLGKKGGGVGPFRQGQEASCHRLGAGLQDEGFGPCHHLRVGEELHHLVAEEPEPFRV